MMVASKVGQRDVLRVAPKEPLMDVHLVEVQVAVMARYLVAMLAVIMAEQREFEMVDR